MSSSPDTLKHDEITVHVPTRSPPQAVAAGQEPPALEIGVLPPFAMAPPLLALALMPPAPPVLALAPPEVMGVDVLLPAEIGLPPLGFPLGSDFEQPLAMVAMDNAIPRIAERKDDCERCMSRSPSSKSP